MLNSSEQILKIREETIQKIREEINSVMESLLSADECQACSRAGCCAFIYGTLARTRRALGLDTATFSTAGRLSKISETVAGLRYFGLSHGELDDKRVCYGQLPDLVDRLTEVFQVIPQRIPESESKILVERTARLKIPV